MPANGRRLIDEVASVSPRPVEMQVLAFGFSRTGTMSMQVALQKLGYKSYHMIEGYRTKAMKYWLEALRAKYANEGVPYQRVEFDKLLGDYSATTDIPCNMFIEELLAAYPDAKVILTERDIESWMTSINRTFYVLFSWWSMYYVTPFEPEVAGPYWKTLNYIFDIWTGGNKNDRDKLRQTYRNHYKHVRQVVPQNQLLEYKPQQGWEPLCTFLGKPVPKEEPYPCINQPDNIIKIHTVVWQKTSVLAVQKIAPSVAALAVVAAAMLYYEYML